MGKLSLAGEIWLFLRQNKKLWLLPIIVVLLLMSALLVFAQSLALAPFIYTIFCRRPPAPTPGSPPGPHESRGKFLITIPRAPRLNTAKGARDVKRAGS